MRLPHGAFVSIINRGIIFLPKPACTAAPPAPAGPQAYVPSFLKDAVPIAGDDSAPQSCPSIDNTHRHVVYWCSGDASLESLLNKEWLSLRGRDCINIDRTAGFRFDLLRDELVEDQRQYVRACRDVHPVDCVLTPTCGISSVLRFRELSGYPVLVTTEHPHGVPGLCDADSARVRHWLNCVIAAASTPDLYTITAAG